MLCADHLLMLKTTRQNDRETTKLLSLACLNLVMLLPVLISVLSQATFVTYLCLFEILINYSNGCSICL